LAELLERLQNTIGDTYRIEKELGGGGMSRVFLAEEVELGRNVVIKVLPPDMAAGVNKERFHREIQLAARLQHPHVVSLLTAGAQDDLLYYVMPYIEGESLRAKLQREGELPVGEAVRLLKEIVDALAYAHSEGVVHRDIKPDNVLLSRNHAVVTDFGVSKAVTASTGSSSLTSLGVALGTPTYMAPEQAAADPHTDHRADIYAVGAMAYEMLTGRPPFTAATPQAVMAAHVSETPDPLTKHRSAASETLNALVMRCLEKKAADRWQSAGDLIPQLEAMTTPSGGITPTGTAPVAAVSAESLLRSSHPLRVVGMFALASIGALAIVYSLVQLLGLPNWVFVGAIALLAIGLPIMLVTGHHERQRAIAQTTGIITSTPASGIKRWLTWRRSIMGGGVAFAGLGVFAAGYTAMRLLGIGPVGTLVATGVLEERDRIILTEFTNHTADSMLGRSVTDAFRVDLGQSSVVNLADASAITAVLRRMDRDPNSPLDPVLALEVAQREGLKAVVAGEIGPAGRGFVLTASVLAAADGQVLTAVRETADDDGEIIDAIDRLSAKLRERVGESLRDIRATDPLEQVTTGSFEALRKYSQALRAEESGTVDRALSLLEEAVALDSTFAMAYRKQAVILSNTFAEFSRVIAAASKAFEHRDRLPEIERYLSTAYYYSNVEFDRSKVTDAYRSVLEIDPNETTSLNNLAVELNAMREWEEAEELAVRATHLSEGHTFFTNAVEAQVGQGKYVEAQATVEQFAGSVDEGNPYLLRMQGWLAAAQRNFDAAERAYHSVLQGQRELTWQADASFGLYAANAMQGKLAAASSYLEQNMEVEAQRDVPANYLFGAARLAEIDVRIREAPSEGLSKVEAALERFPLAGLPPSDRPYSTLIRLYAEAGRVDEATRLASEYETEVSETLRRGDLALHGAEGSIALAEGRYQDAIAAFRDWHTAGDEFCQYCSFYGLGRAFELAGHSDSAVAAYEQAVSANQLFEMYQAPYDPAPTYKRLGELYEERGDREKAVEYYNEFVDLWEDADAELQLLVEDVRGRIAKLISER
jgi:tetratricopeptide (TPR) repeat protein